jgi:hypothetical protein
MFGIMMALQVAMISINPVYHMYLLNCLVEFEGILDSSDFFTLLFKNRSRSFTTPKAFASAQEFASQYE